MNSRLEVKGALCCATQWAVCNLGLKGTNLMTQYGPQTAVGESIHSEKYRGPKESFRESQQRVASALATDEVHFHALKDVLLNMRFMPAGRIQASVGNTKYVTPYNCFVSGTIEDSLVEGTGSIMTRASQAALTMRMGGGIGYDFSNLRPRGTTIRKLQSSSSGPVSFMAVFDAICRAISSSGHRRGAQMGVLRVDHPDIEEFIHAKQNTDKLTGFNISVAVTDDFMNAVEADAYFNLRFNNKVFTTVHAPTLWNAIMRSAYDWAEPGILFIDRINEFNNLFYCERIAATNPCGEQPLPPYGACLLGSFNLVKYLERNGSGEWFLDYRQFVEDIYTVVPAMDRIIDIADYPLFEQEQEAQNKRRMGLGVTGLANTLETLGYSYGSPPFIREMENVLRCLRDNAYRASVELAKVRGPFPLWSKLYTQGAFVENLPSEIIEDIEVFGIRNSHLLSIAPTGTISLAADNISSGIEPVFEYEIDRPVIYPEGVQIEKVKDYAYEHFGVKGKRTKDCTIQDHLAVLATAQRFVDSAVSKTCNVPTDISWEDFKEVYMTAWRMGAKGCTTFRIGGKRTALLTESSEEEPVSCVVDQQSGLKECG